MADLCPRRTDRRSLRSARRCAGQGAGRCGLRNAAVRRRPALLLRHRSSAENKKHEPRQSADRLRAGGTRLCVHGRNCRSQRHDGRHQRCSARTACRDGQKRLLFVACRITFCAEGRRGRADSRACALPRDSGRCSGGICSLGAALRRVFPQHDRLVLVRRPAGSSDCWCRADTERPKKCDADAILFCGSITGGLSCPDDLHAACSRRRDRLLEICEVLD